MVELLERRIPQEPSDLREWPPVKQALWDIICKTCWQWESKERPAIGTVLEHLEKIRNRYPTQDTDVALAGKEKTIKLDINLWLSLLSESNVDICNGMSLASSCSRPYFRRRGGHLLRIFVDILLTNVRQYGLDKTSELSGCLLKCIAAGAFADVYHGTSKDGTVVVVKRAQPSLGRKRILMAIILSVSQSSHRRPNSAH